MQKSNRRFTHRESLDKYLNCLTWKKNINLRIRDKYLKRLIWKKNINFRIIIIIFKLIIKWGSIISINYVWNALRRYK